ncbi:MAG: hypothetical protein OCD00_17725 [Colwellia sp.]
MHATKHNTLNNDDLIHHVAHEAYQDAIYKITELTGLSTQQSLSILHLQFQEQKNLRNNNNSALSQPILTPNEQQFIANLFH